jgi:hypothetical protein
MECKHPLSPVKKKFKTQLSAEKVAGTMLPRINVENVMKFGFVLE